MEFAKRVAAVNVLRAKGAQDIERADGTWQAGLTNDGGQSSAINRSVKWNGKGNAVLSHHHMTSSLTNVSKTFLFEKLTKFATGQDAQFRHAIIAMASRSPAGSTAPEFPIPPHIPAKARPLP